MKQGRTLPELAHELERQACAKRDYLVEAESLCVRSNGHTDLLLDDQGQIYPLNEIAHSQLAEYLGIPKGYYEKLRGKITELRVPIDGKDGHDDLYDRGSYEIPDTPLFDVTLNCLFVDKGADRRLVRTLDGNARAFLSDTFNPDMDNHDVFQIAVKVLSDSGLGPDNVVSCEVTERRLYLKVVSPKLEAVIEPSNLKNGHGLLKEPQVVQAGFVLSNSETGLGSLKVQQLVYKLMCRNGWIQEEAYRQRHLGKALEKDEDGGVYRSDTRKADMTARLLKMRDHIADALDETRFQAMVSRMQESTEVKLKGGIEKTVDVTARKFGLSQAEKDMVLRNLVLGADLSLWGLSNAVTATAQEVTSYDRATELEMAGGRMLALPASEVREIANAG